MSPIREEALMMVQSLPENQLHFIVNVMKELSRLMPVKEKIDVQNYDSREQAFELLESMRKKIPDFDYERELAEYREE